MVGRWYGVASVVAGILEMRPGDDFLPSSKADCKNEKKSLSLCVFCTRKEGCLYRKRIFFEGRVMQRERYSAL
jgi:hypothetical protein